MRLSRTSIAAFGFVAGFFALLPHGACAQSGPQTLQVYSRETIVDVTVTDDKGNHVRGLKRSDFTVEEDGKAQPLRSFRRRE